MTDLSRFLPPFPPKQPNDYLDLAAKDAVERTRRGHRKYLPRFYECGICGAMHWVVWNGDCREDAARFFPEHLDARFGVDGWDEVEMPGTEGADA